MTAFHRFVLAAPAGTVVPPNTPVFAVDGALGEHGFRRGRPTLVLAGTARKNLYHPPAVQTILEKLDSAQQTVLFKKVESAIEEKASASRIREIIANNISADFNANAVPYAATRKECQYYTAKKAKFLGISVAPQTPGHLGREGFIEVHTALTGCHALNVEGEGPLTAGQAIFSRVPLFAGNNIPVGYVVGPISDRDVMISISGARLLA